jgi:hypothetical protein
MLKLLDVCPRLPTDDDYQYLAAAMGAHRLRRGERTLIDWADVMAVILKHDNLGTSIESLNQLCKSLSAPFVFNTDLQVYEANLIFKKWFQWKQPIRFAPIDGNHRCWTISRYFSGRAVDEPIPYTKYGTDLINPNSNMMKTLSIGFADASDEDNTKILQSLRKTSNITQYSVHSRTVNMESKSLWNFLMKEVEDNFTDDERRFTTLEDLAEVEFEKKKMKSEKWGFDTLIHDLIIHMTEKYMETPHYRSRLSQKEKLNDAQNAERAAAIIKEMGKKDFGTAQRIVTMVRTASTMNYQKR